MPAGNTPGISADELGWLSYWDESAPGTPRSGKNTDMLLYTSNTLNAVPDVLNRATPTGTRFPWRVWRHGNSKNGGDIGWTLYGNMGAMWLQKFLGFDALLTLAGSDTVKALTPVTTSAGISTITLTNSTNKVYTEGSLIYINSGQAAEMRPILGIPSNNGAPSTVLKVPQLVTNAAAAAGTLVAMQTPQHNMRPMTGGTSLPTNVLGTIGLSDVRANQYGHEYTGVYVARLQIRPDNGFIGATATLNSIQPRNSLSNSSLPTITFGTGEAGDALVPFDIQDGGFVVYSDPYALGSSAQTFLPVTSWELDLNNNMIEEGGEWNLKNTYQYTPGGADYTLRWNYRNSAGRVAEYYDYVVNGIKTTFPVHAWFAVNTTLSGPAVWYAINFHFPNVVITAVSDPFSIGGVNQVNVEAHAIVNQTDISAHPFPLQIFLSNANNATVYPDGVAGHY